MQKPTTLRDKISQLISVRIGSNMPPLTTVEADYERVAALLECHPLGGLLVFNGGCADNCAETLRRLQRLVSVPLLVAMDMERGSGQQLADHTLWPHALAFDALGAGAADEVERFALWSAQQATSVGIHVSFSPVADIHRNPRNPIIATRALGTTAARVIELATAYVRGCRAGGLLCCAKHFPGHGNTVDDSHDALPVVRETAEELAATDLAPFRALVDSGVEMFMTAHVSYPALDDSGLPATLSRPMLTGLLRQQWGFGGAIVSDSLKMEGVRIGDGGPRTEGALSVQAIKAGVDLLLDVSDVDGVIDQIARTCETDELLKTRVDQALARAWALKQRAFARSQPTSAAAPAEAASHARMVAERALTVVADQGTIRAPIGGKSKVFALLVNPHGDGAYTHTDVIRQALDTQDNVFASRVLTRESPEQTDELMTLAQSADYCLVAIIVKPAAWQTFGIPPAVQSLIQAITRKCPTVVASLGVGDVLEEFPDAAIGLTTYSDVGASQRALVDWFFGR